MFRFLARAAASKTHPVYRFLSHVETDKPIVSDVETLGYHLERDRRLRLLRFCGIYAAKGLVIYQLSCCWYCDWQLLAAR